MDEQAAISWQTVRVFISSTFRDFHAERDYLVKNVFPELRAWCERYRLHLVDVDLRWGVTQEQAESGRVIDVCLEQVDGSRPFFVCLLGSRYGWVPPPETVPDGTRQRYERVIGKAIQRPSDLEASDANLHTGAVNGGTSQLFQQLIFRPAPGFGRAETPVQNVYLGSAGATPGGGVHGVCGRNAARAALAGDSARGWPRRRRTERL